MNRSFLQTFPQLRQCPDKYLPLFRWADTQGILPHLNAMPGIANWLYKYGEFIKTNKDGTVADPCTEVT